MLVCCYLNRLRYLNWLVKDSDISHHTRLLQFALFQLKFRQKAPTGDALNTGFYILHF